MGTKCAPVYVTLFMAYQKLERRFGKNIRNEFEKNWGRYLDDCLLIGGKNIIPIQELHHILNNLHPGIKFTMQYNKKEMNFLRINMQVKGKKQ